jgi:tetratricopeptide (TPR) repeat protein
VEIGVAKARSPERIPSWERWGVPLILLVVTLAAFCPVFGAGLTYDDFAVVHGPGANEAGAILAPSRWLEFGRTTRILSLELDRALFGDRTSAYHLQNVFWHFVASLGVFALARRLSGSSGIGLAAALLFVVHPIHVEAVANISNRKELLASAFALGSMLAYLRFLGGSTRYRWLWFGLSILALWGAFLSKETTVMLPFVAVVAELMFVPKERRLLSRSVPVLAIGLVLGIAALALYVSGRFDFGDLRTISTFGGYEGVPEMSTAILTSARAFWIQVRLLLLPVGLTPDHSIALSRSLVDPATTLAAWVGLAGVVALPFLLRRREPLVAFGLAWFLLFLVPTSNLVPISYYVAERYLYLPSVGLSLAAVRVAGRILDGLPERGRRAGIRRAGLGLGVATLAVLAFAAFSYTRDWRDERSLWERVLRSNPDSWKAHNNLGVDDFLAGRVESAIAHFDRAIENNPRSAQAWYNRGNAWNRLGRADKAIADYARALEIRPDHWAAAGNRGAVLLSVGRIEEATADLDRAIEIHPGYANAYFNRGLAHRAAGRTEEAIRDLEQALEIEPRNELMRQVLAETRALANGER